MLHLSVFDVAGRAYRNESQGVWPACVLLIIVRTKTGDMRSVQDVPIFEDTMEHQATAAVYEVCEVGLAHGEGQTARVGFIRRDSEFREAGELGILWLTGRRIGNTCQLYRLVSKKSGASAVIGRGPSDSYSFRSFL